MFTAILSTTVLPKDGTYRVTTLSPEERPDLTGVPHFVGHPATREIVESLGAVPAPSKLFPGQEVGEQVVCFPIIQGQSDRAMGGNAIHQSVRIENLVIRVVTRIE
jgi:hypothetical protein